MKKPAMQHTAQASTNPKQTPDSEAGQDFPPPLHPDCGQLRQEMEKYRDLALRSAAELENYRKRMVREQEESRRYANAVLFERLLPVVDSFELGLEAARGAADAAAIVQGFEMVEKQLHDFLSDNGLEQIDAAGQKFDPNRHEAVAHQHDAAVAEGEVLHQIRKGYRLRDRLLRPASVVVSKGPAAQ